MWFRGWLWKNNISDIKTVLLKKGFKSIMLGIINLHMWHLKVNLEHKINVDSLLEVLRDFNK